LKMSDININRLMQLKSALDQAQENTFIMRTNITAFETRLVNLDEVRTLQPFF